MTRNAANMTSPISLSSGGTATTTLSTQYGVAYYDGSGVSVTGAGTASQVFTSNGAGVAPSFQTASRRAGTGAWTLIGTVNASAASNVIFSGLTSDYNVYMLNWSNVSISTATNPIYFVFGTSPTTFATSGYKSGTWYTGYTKATLTNTNTTSYLRLASGDSTRYGTALITGIGRNTYPTILVDGMNAALTMTSGNAWMPGATVLTTSATYTSMKIYPSGGTITGQISLYGLAK
jgi:hypothetical protein